MRTVARGRRHRRLFAPLFAPPFAPLIPSLLALALLALTDARGSDAISEAEQRAFLDDHLANITRSETLDFQFIRKGGTEKPYEDSVALQVRLQAASGTKSVAVDYLNGEHRVTLPSVDDAHGNPLVMFFLEADIRDMSRRTGGSPAYFRKRIRLALAQAADVDKVHVAFAGADVAATEIRIRPYHDDPLRERLRNFGEKQYVLTLAAEIPGGVYQLRTVTPAADGTAPAVEEILTFKGAIDSTTPDPEVR